MAGEVEISLQVDIDHAVPLLLGHFPAHAVPIHTGIVDQDVDTAEFFDGCFDHVSRIGKRSDIALDGDGLGPKRTDLTGQFLSCVSMLAIEQADIGALAAKGQRGGRADPLGSPADNGILVLQ